MSTPNPLDAMEQATRTNAPSKPTPANPLDAMEMATRGKNVIIPDDQNQYKQPWSPMKFLVGLGKPLEEFGQGAMQFGADIFANQADEAAAGEDQQTSSPLAEELHKTSADIGKQVASNQQAYKESPYGVAQTKSGKGGEVVGTLLPWLVPIPGVEAPEGTAFLGRLGYGALGDAAKGVIIGSAQPVLPGQSRVGNAVSSTAGSVAAGAVGRTIGEGLKWASASVPILKNKVAAYHAGQFLAEQADPSLYQQGAKAAEHASADIPGFNPTTAGATQSPQVGSLERYIAQKPEYAPLFNQTATDNKQALLQAIDKLSPGAMDASPTELSQAIGRNLNDIVSAANEKEDAIWNDSGFLKLPTNVTRLQQGLTSWAEDLPVSDRNRLPQWPFQDVQQIIKENGPTAPISEIQSLRSNLLREARGMETTNPNQARLLSQMAGQLLKNLGTGQGFTAAEEQGGNALRAASAFTAQKHAAFEPLKPAIAAAEGEESRVGPWMTNINNPVPERLNAYLDAGQKYLDNADKAPEDARAYFVNLLSNSRAVNPANGPIRSANLEAIISKNQPVIDKLFPFKAQQDLIDNIQSAAKMGDFVAGQKPMDFGSDTTNKLLGNVYMSEKLGGGLRATGWFGKVMGWAMNLPSEQRMQVISQALMDPQKAALLTQDATSGTLAQAAKAFGIAGKATTAAVSAYGANKVQSITQKPTAPP